MDAVAHEILPGLWLGDYRAALNDAWLSSHGIKTVFNCTKDLPFSQKVLRRFRLPVDDNLAPAEIANMHAWGGEAVSKVIGEMRRGAPVLIHCYAGKQRSAALTAMTLIVLMKKTYVEAIAYIQSRRPVAFTPAANFLPAIVGFEEDLKRAAAAAAAHKVQ
jgi:dual specificity phosphatase 12